MATMPQLTTPLLIPIIAVPQSSATATATATMPEEHDEPASTDQSSTRQLPSDQVNLICPPAPRKKPTMLSRKRRLLIEGLPEVITVSAEELGAAFRKRRRPADVAPTSAATSSCCGSEAASGKKRKR